MTAEEKKELEQRTREQNERNKARSTGSRADQDKAYNDPTAEAREYMERLEQAYKNSPADQLDGQETLPGFEPQPTDPTDTEAIKRKISKVSFKIECMKSPEDALIAWGAPKEALEKYYKAYYEKLFQTAANELMADPKQLADKEKRTPEQEQKLNEIAARETLSRLDRFLKSRWYNALTVFENTQPKFNAANLVKNDNTAEAEDLLPLEAEAALYYFAIHEEIDPTETAELTEEQTAELKDIFTRLDNFCCDYWEQAQRAGKPLEDGDLADLLYIFIDAQRFTSAEKPAAEQPKKSKYTQAEESGAIMTIGNRLFVPTDPEYQFAFTTSTRANIGFFMKDKDGKNQMATGVNSSFMLALAKAIKIHIEAGKSLESDIEVYFPAFLRELELHIKDHTATQTKEDGAQEVQDLTITRGEARERFINQLIVEWDNLWGVLPGSNKEYKMMAVHTYDPDTEHFTFQSPYINQVFRGISAKNEQRIQEGEHFYLWESELLHSSVANERNQAAVEMATRILQGVQQRGLTPDARLNQNRGIAFKDDSEITFTITCQGLINDCPQIREKLKAKANASRKTQELKRTFPVMYKILHKKTDLFSYYKDLTITEIVPTAKTLGARIIVKHHGGNPAYQKQVLPTAETVTKQPTD